ncbi:BTAD domain-containing putative transcriptional regulator [Streptomyces sp. NPDC086787]|uniref:BTAD domain-containing putative transcriptional regulator n=1 Tax=Streptomyces sp. NPDC086787 TaxID=3365759 RepID=UPI00382E8B2C
MARRSTSSSTGTPTAPRNRTPQPVRVRRRSFGDFVKAFLAFLALLVLVLGVPGALAVEVGWPLPHGVPSLDWLQQEITVQTFLHVLTVIVWFAWAQFTACVLVEVKAALSGVGIPGRVPGSGPSQLLARQLVAALLLVGATAASLTPGLSQLGHSPEGNHKGTVAAAQQTPGLFAQEREQAADTAGALAAQAGHAAAHARADVGGGSAKAADTKYYRIQPPEGRHHDSLWEIAQRHLGDGRRYKEIYELNKDRAQPDGSRLSEASLIRPGWIMEMPGDAHGGDLVENPDAHVSHEVRQHIADYARTGDHAREQGHAAHKDQGHGAQGDQGHGAQDPATAQISVPAQRPAPAGEEQSAHTTPAASETGATGHSFGLPEALLGAPLLAAGLLGALGRRRRQALWQSALGTVGGRRGMEPPTPTGDAQDVHDALLVGADPDGVRLLDRALRGLAASLAAESRPLPVVYAAWLSDGDLHLQLAQPAEPPAPWQVGQDQTFWMLARTDAERYEDADTAAPYPGLVSLGTMDGSRLLLNLEAVPGIVSLSGRTADRAAVFASVAAELATNGWSDRMTITLVGFGADLTPLAPNRLRHLDGVEDLIEAMEAETRQRRGALGTAGHDSVLTGRTGPAQHTRWAPHLVLLADRPADDEAAARLAELATDAGRLGIGYLVGTDSGELPGAAWEMEITPEGKLLAPLLGLELDAQVLPAVQHRAIVELFAEADPESDPDGPATAPPFLVDVSEQGRPAVYARLVGPYEVIGLGNPQEERSALLHEALALLLLHREGVHPLVLASALWPRGVTEDVRDALVERLRAWLGTDPDGTPRLGTDPTGRLTLAKSVVSDLDVLRSLYHEATQGRGADSRAIRGRLLTDALVLVRGPLLADRPEGRYGWLTHEIIDAQLPLLVADTGLALSAFHLEKDRAEKAIEALNAALKSAPDDERLWHELLRAAHATGDPDRVRSLAADLLGRSGARGLPPRTEALLDELLPSWREGAAAAG